MALSKILNASVTNSTLTGAKVASSTITGTNISTSTLPNLGRRNLIINGAMQVWQRGVSQTSAGYGSVDRFQMSNSTSTFTTTRQAFATGQTDVPNNPSYYLRCVVSSGGAAGNYMFMSHGIEGVQTGAGQTVTLSFYAKASSALKVGVNFQQVFGTSGSSTVSTNGVAKTLSTSWVRYTVTTTLPSISSKTIGTASDNLRLLLWLDSGSTYNTTSGSIGNQSGTFEFSNIQLEVGSVATPFEHRSYGEEQQLCFRYFFKEPGGNHQLITGGSAATGDYYDWYPLPTRMRAAPSCTVALGGDNYGYSGAAIMSRGTTHFVNLRMTKSGGASGSYYTLSAVTADSEL
jgi:hypothetical protein